MTEKEFISNLEDTLAYKDLLGVQALAFITVNTEQDILDTYSDIILEYYYYLRIFQRREDFLMCAKIRDVLALEQNAFLSIILNQKARFSTDFFSDVVKINNYKEEYLNEQD